MYGKYLAYLAHSTDLTISQDAAEGQLQTSDNRYWCYNVIDSKFVKLIHSFVSVVEFKKIVLLINYIDSGISLVLRSWEQQHLSIKSSNHVNIAHV